MPCGKNCAGQCIAKREGKEEKDKKEKMEGTGEKEGEQQEIRKETGEKEEGKEHVGKRRRVTGRERTD
jgi:hypothetical protein